MQVPQCSQKASQVMMACNTPEKAEPEEQVASSKAADVTTAGVQSTEDEALSKTEEKAEGENAEAPEKCLGEDLIKDTEEESTSLQGEPEAELAKPKEQV